MNISSYKLVSLLLVNLLTTQFAQAQYCITGSIEQVEGKVYLTTLNRQGDKDTLHVGQSSGFKFQGYTDKAQATTLEFEKDQRLHIPIFLENADYHITTGDSPSMRYQVSGGGPLQKAYHQLVMESIRCDQLIDSMTHVYEKDYPNDRRFAHLQVRGFAQSVYEKYDAVEDSFIQANDNIISSYLIYSRKNQLLREKKIPQKYQLLGENARKTNEGILLEPIARKAAQIVVGGIAPEITMQTPEGETRSLHNIPGKIKIIDFWASWCGPCRAENPNLKKIYAEYHSKGLEIISISLDQQKEAWEKAIKQDQLPWVHLSDLKGWNSPVVQLYRIQSVPRTFILDDNNRIIQEELRGDNLYQFVAEYLK